MFSRIELTAVFIKNIVPSLVLVYHFFKSLHISINWIINPSNYFVWYAKFRVLIM